MASTIENFIIGIGLDYDKSGERKALAAIGSIKSKALQLAAVTGAGLGFKALTIDAANNAAAISKLSSALGISQKSITAFGSAIQQEGGSLDESIGLLRTFTKLQDDLQKNLRPELFSDLSRIGVDPNILLNVKNAENAERAISSVIQGIEKLSPETQRKALQVIGADSQALLLTAQKGVEHYESVVRDAVTRLKTDANFGKEAEVFNVELLKLNETISSITREISGELVPAITPVVTGMNDWITANREFISTGIENTSKFVAEHFKEIAAALGLIAGYGVLKLGKGLVGVSGKVGQVLKGSAKSAAMCCPEEKKPALPESSKSGKGGKGGTTGGMGAIGGGSSSSSTGQSSSRFDKILSNNKAFGFASKIPVAGEAVDTVALIGGAFIDILSYLDEMNKKAASSNPYGAFTGEPLQGTRIPEPTTATEMSNRPIQIEANLHMDGQVIGRAAINAMELENNKTYSEFVSSTGA